jgi:3-oxoacyl-ACP reductase-like protein
VRLTLSAVAFANELPDNAARPTTRNDEPMTNTHAEGSELSDQRTLVTGGTKGMGEAIVKRLRQAGATVMTTARSRSPNLHLPDLFIEADISTPDGVQKVV